MDCNQVRPLLSAYVDGELDARSCLELEGHVESCNGCRGALEAIRQTKRLVSQSAPYFRSPSDLSNRIQASIAPPAQRRLPQVVKVVSMAASIVLAVGIGWILGRNSLVRTEGSTLLASHVRAMMSDHLTDVLSSDRHTVKPWFNGKIDFSPTVNDFTQAGFPLIGGRLEYLEGNRVAVLVYKRAKHVIDLYVAPLAGGLPTSNLTERGFNEVHWASGGFEYWAISDVNQQDLNQFVELVRKNSP